MTVLKVKRLSPESRADAQEKKTALKFELSDAIIQAKSYDPSWVEWGESWMRVLDVSIIQYAFA